MNGRVILYFNLQRDRNGESRLNKIRMKITRELIFWNQVSLSVYSALKNRDNTGNTMINFVFQKRTVLNRVVSRSFRPSGEKGFFYIIRWLQHRKVILKV